MDAIVNIIFNLYIMINRSKIFKNIFIVIAQIILISLIWLLADWISYNWLPVVPSSILGLFMLLLAIFMGVPIRWFGFGAYWLIANMLLFFIPALISVVNYQELIISQGIGILAVICLSTLLVMATTALVVEQCYKWQTHLRRKYRLGKRSGGEEGI